MHIIFGQEIVQEVRDKHTCLELETFLVDGESKTAYCVVPGECISIAELPDLDRKKRLHQALIDAYNNKEYNTVLITIDHLMGSFGGELDSFYQIIRDRIKGEKVE
jgi:hypothetical protein